MINGIASPVTSGREHRGSGMDDAVAVTQGKEGANWPYEGQASFADLVPILSAHFGVPASSSGGITTFKPLSDQDDTLASYTLAQGSDTGCKKSVYGFVPDWRFRSTLSEVTQSGMFNARKITYGGDLPDYDVLAAIPLNEADWQVYLGTAMDGGDLVAYGSEEGVLDYEFNSTGRLRGQNFADGTKSFADARRQASQKVITLTMEDNTTAGDLMDSLRVGDVGLIRYRCPGPVIDSSNSYLFQITNPYQFLGRADADHDGLVGAAWQVKPIWHPGFLASGGALEVIVHTE